MGKNPPILRILTHQFFDRAGTSRTYGGSERYLEEFLPIATALGLPVEVYQDGTGWRRQFSGVDFRSLDAGSAWNYAALARLFAQHVPDDGISIYWLFPLIPPTGGRRMSVAICHGIDWDFPWRNEIAGLDEENLGRFNAARLVVSVDTAVLGWVRAHAPALTEKIRLIPNFVDTRSFTPAPGARDEAPSRLRLLYPRTLYEARGYWLVAAILPRLFAKYPELDAHFAGHALPKETEHVRALVAAHPGRVAWSAVPPEEMPRVYREADITVVPTCYSEGTSLSCLEALASGNAVIATNVGGLRDIVRSRYNGILIEPAEAPLEEAISLLIEDRALRERLGTNGVRVARAFDIGFWRNDWRRVLAELVAISDGPPVRSG